MSLEINVSAMRMLRINYISGGFLGGMQANRAQLFPPRLSRIDRRSWVTRLIRLSMRICSTVPLATNIAPKTAMILMPRRAIIRAIFSVTGMPQSPMTRTSRGTVAKLKFVEFLTKRLFDFLLVRAARRRQRKGETAKCGDSAAGRENKHIPGSPVKFNAKYTGTHFQAL